jgi:tRNA (cmo5U34)-methyltransferase
MSGFDAPAAVEGYVENLRRQVPGLADLHAMTALLLAEGAAVPSPRMLILGAGGGEELLALHARHPDWQLTGVDPSAAMLGLARQRLAEGAATLIEGTIEAAPQGPFDGAVCLLVLHFLDRAARKATLAGIAARLRPGAVLVIAQHAAPAGATPVTWLARSQRFGGADPIAATKTAGTMAERLCLLDEAEVADLLTEAGFAPPALFYAAFSFRGWVTHRV